MDDLPDDVIRGELSPGEKLLWSGRPVQGVALRMSDAFLIPFSILWGGFAIFWEAAVLSSNAPVAFALFGIPFVLMGIHFMLGRFWVDARQRAATAYGVTSERVLIVSGVWSRSVKSLSLDNLSDVSLTERSDGRGIITLGPLPFMHSWYVGTGWPRFGMQVVPYLDLAENARAVYELIRDAQRASRRSR